MFKKYLKPLLKKQDGYASFVITLITIAVVGLIVVAFASDSRLEQKNSLANNLSTQAYYAAESGVNDAYAVVSKDVLDNVPTQSTGPYCANSSAADSYNRSSENVYVYNGSDVLNPSNGDNVKYSCLIVNPNPNSLSLGDVIPGEAQVIPVTSNSSSIKYLTISWEYNDASGGLSFAGCPNSSNSPAATLLATTATYPSVCGAGVLQLDMISDSQLNTEIGATAAGGNSFDSLATTVFLEPTTGSATSAGAVAVSNNQVIYVSCNASAPTSGINPQAFACTQKLKLNPATTYYLHLQDFDETNQVSVVVQHVNNSTTVLPISGSQIMIDSTGDANGQLKRLVEWVCANSYCSNSNIAPGVALQSTQCLDKHFTIYALDPSQPSNPAACP